MMRGQRFVLILMLALLIPVTLSAQEKGQQQQAQGQQARDEDSSGKDTWTVNLKEADIRALVNQVSDITGYSFVVDPRVKGKVTVVSETPMTRAQVYQLFLSVLHVHGFTAVPGDDVIKVIQQSDAKQSAEDTSRFKEIPKEQLVTRVIGVENINAMQLVPILRPMVASYGHLAGVSASNALIISDHQANIERMTRLIGQLDQPADYEIEVIRLEEAWVGDMVDMLQELAPAELAQSGGQDSNRKASVVADERSNRIIVRGSERFRGKVRDLVKKLDTPSESRGTTKVIRLNHANAADLSELLSNLMSESGGAGQGGGSGGSGQETSVSVFADEGLNALVLRAPPSRMNEIEFIVNRLDVRRAQVLIEAAIVEISSQAGEDLGVQFALGDQGGKVPLAGTSFQNVGLSAAQVLGALQSDEAVAPTSGGATIGAGEQRDSGLSWGVLIQALANSSRANLLSTPSIITLDNEESEIVVGQEVPFRTGQATSTGDGLENPFTTIEREDVGLTLKVQPSISADDVVKLDVEQTTEDIAQSVQNAADLITEKREIKTVVLADDSETIVLGGLMSDDYRTTESKVPFLGDIPYLGALFRSESKTREKRNLVVFLRPTILREEGEGKDVAKEKFNRLWNLNLDMQDGEDGYEEPRPDVESLFEGGNPMSQGSD